MRRHFGIALMLAVLATGTADAQYAMAGGAATGTITLSGGSTLRSWSCDITRFDAAVRASSAASADAMPSGREQATFTIPVRGIDCRNGTMNSHLRDALQGERHPEIEFELDRYALVDGSMLRAEGTLTVAGRATPVTVEAAYTAGDGTLRVRGHKQLRMTELGVEPPRLMLGTLRVHDEITIAFDLVIRQSAVTLAALSAAAGH